MKLETKKEKLRSKIKSAIVDVILSSTSHGLPNIIRTNNIPIKLMWIFFTLISTGLCAYMIFQSFVTYFNYEVTTTTRIKNEFKSIYPTVTVCNLNYFTTEYSKFVLEPFLRNLNLADPLDNKIEIFLKGMSDKMLSQNPNLTRSKLGDSLEKLMITCHVSMERCNISQIKKFYHSNYGNCYSINSGYDSNGNEVELLTTIGPIRTFSIRLVLNSSVIKQLNHINPNGGVVVLIHNKTTHPMLADEITAMPKTETNIALSRVFYSSMPKPYSDCDANLDDENSFDSELYKLVFQNTKGYNQNLCVTMCFQRLVIKDCKCYISNFPSFFKAEPCSFESQNCIDYLFKIFSGTNFIRDVCYKECPLECERMMFQKTISISQFPKEDWIRFLQVNNNNGSLYFNKTIQSDDMLAINVYYDTLSYIQIEETPSMDFVGLLSNLGGVAGLFLGVSVLSFVEIIEVIMQIFVVIGNHKKVSQTNK